MHRLLPAMVLLLAALAGCFGGGGGGDAIGPPADRDKGVIRGLVVDQSVVPVEGATVEISGGVTTVTDALGVFNFTGLDPGEYIVTAGKPGYAGSQTTTTVVAGVPEPAILKLLIERLSTAQPFVDHFKLDGFYECAHGLFFVTDTCDWVPRTAWDVANESGNPPPTPRSALRYYNTQYVDVPEDTYAIIQEAFWDDEAVSVLWVMMDETPIDASCDCSDSYSNVIQESPTYNRVDRFDALGNVNTNFTVDYVNGEAVGVFPNGKTVAVRGFIPFQQAPGCDFPEVLDPNNCADPQYQNTDPNQWYSVAQNFEFTVITSLFHNYAPPEGWTFEAKDDYPVG
jgi:hypothetical protein